MAQFGTPFQDHECIHNHPMAPQGYGKRNAPGQQPRSVGDFKHLNEREASLAAFIDALPVGAAMGYKTLAKTLPTLGQAACRKTLRELSRAGHLRRYLEAAKPSITNGLRWVTRTFFSRSPRDQRWWESFRIRNGLLPLHNERPNNDCSTTPAARPSKTEPDARLVRPCRKVGFEILDSWRITDGDQERSPSHSRTRHGSAVPPTVGEQLELPLPGQCVRRAGRITHPGRRAARHSSGPPPRPAGRRPEPPSNSRAGSSRAHRAGGSHRLQSAQKPLEAKGYPEQRDRSARTFLGNAFYKLRDWFFPAN